MRSFLSARARLVVALVLVDCGLVASFWGGGITTTPHQPTPSEPSLVARRSYPSASSAGSWADNTSGSSSYYGNSERLLRLRWGSYPGHHDPELERMGDQGDDDEDSDYEFDERMYGSEAGEKTKIVEFQVKLQRPLGLYLAEDARGVVVSQVLPGGNAEKAGIRIGDRITATSSTMGSQMWKKNTVDGVRAAIDSRFIVSDHIVFNIERSPSLIGDDSISGRRVTTYEVVLEKPLGVELIQADPEGGVFIKSLVPQGNAAKSGLVQPYDRVVAISASLGDHMWPTDSVQGVQSAISTRIGTSVKLRLERSPEVARIVAQMSRAITNQTTTAEVLLLGSKSSVKICNEMARAVREEDHERAISIFKLAMERGVAPDAALCTMLIKAYGRNRQVDKAMDVLRMMEEANIRPDLTTINTAIAVCGWRDRLEMAEKLFFDELPRLFLRPNRVTFNIVLNIYGRRGKWTEALSMLDQMQTMKIKPDVVTYTALITGATKANKMTTAFKYLQLMVDDGLKPDIGIYNALIVAHRRNKDWYRAVQLLQLMEAKGVKPDMMTYSYVLSLLVDAKRYDIALDVYEGMMQKGISPSREVYTTVLDLFAKLGDVKKAVVVFKEMRKKKMNLDRAVYSALMEAFITSGNPSAALSIHEEMLKEIPTDDTTSLVMTLRCHAELGDLVSTQKIWEEMHTLGMNPGPNARGEFLRASIRAGDYGMARRLFRDLLDDRAVLKDKVFSYLLQDSEDEEVREQSGELVDLYHDALRMCREQSTPVHARLYSTFLLFCGRCKRYDLAKEVMSWRESGALRIGRAKANEDFIGQWEDFITSQMVAMDAHSSHKVQETQHLHQPQQQESSSRRSSSSSSESSSNSLPTSSSHNREKEAAPTPVVSKSARR